LGYGGWEAGVGKDWKLNALWLVGEKLPDHSCGSKEGEGRNRRGRRERDRMTDT
jgi:hypothetical protein